MTSFDASTAAGGHHGGDNATSSNGTVDNGAFDNGTVDNAFERRATTDAMGQDSAPADVGGHEIGDGEIQKPESMGLLHESVLGRGLLSILLLSISLGLVAWNIPRSEVRSEIRDRLEAPVNLTGLNQGWEVFAPNPPRTHVVMTARITYDDGSTADFGFPEGEPFLGAFREYRWRKWERRLRLSRNSGFRAQSTDWIAREHEVPGKRITEVMLIETRARTPEIGSDEDLEWTTEDVFRRTFDEDRLPRSETLD